MSFEQKAKRLEEIVVLLEGGKVELEKVSELFEEGVAITKECSDMLKENQGKITKLQKELASFTEKPMN